MYYSPIRHIYLTYMSKKKFLAFIRNQKNSYFDKNLLLTINTELEMKIKSL